MTTPLTRRDLMRCAAVLAAGAALGTPRRRALANTPKAMVQSTTVISQLPYHYHGWPTLARRADGELLVTCSGGRESHVCPFGRVELIRSRDEGRSWSFPRVLLDSPIDDRDSGVLETAKGSLLVTTFTSLAYETRLAKAESESSSEESAWSPGKLRRWQAAHNRVEAAQREVLLGSWMLRSTDGGATWSAPSRCIVNSPHGPIQLSDGRQLYAGKIFSYGRAPVDGGRIGACDSIDDGQTWRWLGEIPTRQGDEFRDYHELHAVETDSGRLVAHVRNHNKANERETLQSESDDGGKTWSTPHAIGVWGYPSHLLRLRDGRLLMTYGHRREPLGNQARTSDDEGRSWSEPMIVSGDGTSSDLGYPSTVELTDGSLLTVWYELMDTPGADLDHYNSRSRDEAWFRMTAQRRSVLRQARWSLR